MKWDLYDELIDSVPADLTVQECLVGIHWTAVRSAGTGLALTSMNSLGMVSFAGSIAGMRVRDLAGYAKSWNNYEAACGMAAINSVVNARERVEAVRGRPLSDEPTVTAFEFFRDQMKGKKVAVIGHFPGLESLANICQLSILERNPQAGDFPDPACEYILPEQDFVFITGATLINKTLPRLLELSRSAFTVVIGPTTPLSPILFKYGVDAVGSSVVVDQPRIWRAVQEGAHQKLFHNGARMVQICCADVSNPQRRAEGRGQNMRIGPNLLT